MEPTCRNLRFVHVGPNGPRISALHRFYAEQRSEHLFPRTQDELSDIAAEGAMFAVEHGDTIAAACYVKWVDEDLEIREFGGICVGANYLGKKIASNLASLAIGQALTVAKTLRLEAKVHVGNDAPNGLLKSLGFKLTEDIERLPSEAVRPPMKPSEEDGSVTGRVWEFEFGACRNISNKLRGFPPRIDNCHVVVDLGEYTGSFRGYLHDIATELDGVASKHDERR